ncbi:LOW QUALITY PROTEIN: hypothetical protein MXB_2897 [Myxobolus squamalis]|nr:LOW QUALITY PROTEIN: hypothetical protein MXB_2897 [Myxobolus squamalis]
MKILVVDNVERDEMEFISSTIGCRPAASPGHFTTDSLGSADLVEEVSTGFDKFVKITGIHRPFKTVSIVVRGSNDLVLDETARSIHDALCVIRSLVKGRYLIAGGGAPEIEMAYRLEEQAQLLSGTQALCVQAFARALELIPITLIESAGLNPVDILTELRKKHAEGCKTFGFNVKKSLLYKSSIRDMMIDNVVQPLLVTSSALRLASEEVRCILKIDDIVTAVR